MSSFGQSIVSLTGKTGVAMAESVLRTIAVGTTLSLCILAPAQAATFQISWTGQILGYSAEGRFSYDDTQTYESGIVRGDDLDAFDIAFFDPQGNLIQEFEDNHLTYAGFNFNFDTQTGEILQDGFFDEPNGIDIGEYTPLFDDAGEFIGATGLNFWSAAPLTPDGEPVPHVHLTDFGDEFLDLPIGFAPHLDVAFFTRTRAQLLDDPEAGDQLGQRMVATPVPEPGALVGLSAIALLACRLQRSKGQAKSV
ncbi:PEP-CTERM sorting domain-containing protein [Nodosilinea sp. LEGE 07088]|uniref:PEP-CTERM sorting domain-containing protein n=1 Tax=Nodosilinea sp. LEGE 07088 TaxID=2777968 RepID=UPI00188007C8|nr:PEP-CTERM sorting domain-containing protein [Nodosilinea sp. LEGE 07088]MBE9140660.1 PEP-CTERM sorting domain-containing protein [Nodosilinea sp. LEGE 07088]